MDEFDTLLMKAKYKSRRRGSGGKYIYEYERPQGKKGKGKKGKDIPYEKLAEAFNPGKPWEIWTTEEKNKFAHFTFNYEKLNPKKRRKAKRKVHKSMIDPVETEKLSKGMHEFHIVPGAKAPALPDDYLQDYLDAFIEEAYEHEYKEKAHQAPRLEGGDPYMYLARCIYNELLIFAVHNHNLLRAVKKFDIKHPRYVLERLNYLGICRVNSENYAADRDAQVGGYHPEKVEGLALESPPGYQKSLDAVFAATQRDEQKFKIAGGNALATAPEMVRLEDDGVDPFAALKKSIDSRPDALGRRFVLDQGTSVTPTTDVHCPVHGMGDLTKSMNLSNLYVQCLCPESK